ncbi:protein of unknown function [Dethiosulfatibacter aminovorans DSM 17477]|uniref:DUF1904 domain-containing protein n=1 Tax=Dethiosulfatibacter aminovorans DSM 17477 TaxID=1121476 RepID=A0A1M6MNR4_9FIRM|nr:DUF1904 family protein [Dethiosulfatibacter aminovorans]SHJ85128.1 protein of unknown function [Dethiosulfatibacter aminovorans DSM 17477]
MPQITFRGIKKETVKNISGRVVNELKDIVNAPADWFTIEYMYTEFFVDGEFSENYPLIQVHWFGRDLEVQDSVASVLTDILIDEGYPEVEISFHTFDRRSYYANKRHFAE